MYKVTTTLTLILGVIFFMLSVPEYSGDIKNHVVWARSLIDLGTLGFYERDFPGFAFPNYPPVAMLLFAMSLKLYQATNSIVWFLNTQLSFFPSALVNYFERENVMIAFLKLPALFSHFFLAFGVSLISLKLGIKKALLVWLLVALNPALIYLTVVWGQIDLLPLGLLIFSLLFLYSKKNIMSIVFLALALLSKQTIVIFLPLMLYLYYKQFSVATAFKNIALLVGLFYLSYLPFHSFDISWPIKLYRLNFELVAHSINENAFNLWGALFGFKGLSDTDIYFYGLNYQQIGYLLFAVVMVIPSLSFLRRDYSLDRVVKFMFLISAAYYLFLTRMHERYLAASLVFIIIMSQMDKRYMWGMLFFTFLYLANLYRGLFLPSINLIQNPELYLNLVAPLVILYIVLVTYYIYDFNKK